MFKEVAKFFAGVTAWEALTHASFATPTPPINAGGSGLSRPLRRSRWMSRSNPFPTDGPANGSTLTPRLK